MIDQNIVKKLFYYDAESGMLIWRNGNGRNVKPWQQVKAPNGNGYYTAKINGKSYLVHRLAWLYMTGEMPINDIDHINGIVIDNRLCNLRQATASENLKNARIRNDNKSGEKGVCFDINRKKWMASASLNGKNKFLGRFDNLQDASDAYQSFAKLHHGDFYYAKSRGSNNA